MPPDLKKSINQAHLKNGTYEQIVTHLERELELNGLEAPDELLINTVSQKLTSANADRSKPTCHHCGKPGHYRNRCRLLKKQREETEKNQNNPGNKNSDANNYIPDNNTKNNDHNNFKNSNRAETNPETVHLPCETCGKTNYSAERCYVGANAANRPLPWKRKREDQSGHFQQDAQNNITGFWVSGPNILTINATSSLSNCEWQIGDHQKKIPVIPVVVWQQLLETSVEIQIS